MLWEYTFPENDGWTASDTTGRVHSLRDICPFLLQESISEA